ncbi:hypothetical protein [Nitrosomonas nitrosa]|uniref:hypothetical protein n=1 Tax=Nitrosomonas nitrosa TaxID=52442 RepID=UPI0023F6E1FC|nr:hypothetical protein [Nitrosomonas nitrosa]MCO6435418.1 hypothetical protein [Nitrosomonas nitrosa]
MSDISLYSGLYETIRRWADLIDDVIVNLKLNDPDVEQISFSKLEELFSTLIDDEGNPDFSDKRLASIIENELDRKIQWGELAGGLKDPVRRTSIIPILESIAQCLGKKHADTVAKMRWGYM